MPLISCPRWWWFVCVCGAVDGACRFHSFNIQIDNSAKDAELTLTNEPINPISEQKSVEP